MLVLNGKIQTPMVTKQTTFELLRCKAQIINPRRRYYSKIQAGRAMYPYSFQCYLGTLELCYKGKSEDDCYRKLQKLLKIKQIGRFSKLGLGKIKWLHGEVTEDKPKAIIRKYPKIRIRKGLPHNLPEEVNKLLKYALLHDFAHTERHKSKIYIEPEVDDLERLRKHHDKTDDEFINKFQYYDRLASRITRNIRSPRSNRYNWSSNSPINFEKLAKEIKEVSNNLWKLYEYIYKSRKLGQLTESLEYGHTSLRYHLILIANLIVRDFQNKRI